MSSGASFPLALSLAVASLATLLVTVIGVPVAYLLATREFPGKRVLDALVTLPLILPPVVTGYYLLLLVGRTGPVSAAWREVTGKPLQVTFTWVAAVIAAFVIALPFTVKTARAAIEGVDPGLTGASLALGRSELHTALFVTLPVAARGILAGTVLSFARALGEYGATVVVAGNIPGRTNTMPLEIYNAVVYGDWRAATLLVAVFTMASVVFLLVAGRLTSQVVRP